MSKNTNDKDKNVDGGNNMSNRDLKARTTTNNNHQEVVDWKESDDQWWSWFISPWSLFLSSSSSSTLSKPTRVQQQCRQNPNKVIEEAFQSLSIQRMKIIINDLNEEEQKEHYPHVCQVDSWDCGVACLLMVAQWLQQKRQQRQQNDDEFTNRLWILKQLGTHSIWTIDLVHILCQWQQHFSTKRRFDFVLSSQVLGVNPQYQHVSYYQSNLYKDTLRVEQLFQSILLAQQQQQSTSTASFRLVQMQHLNLDFLLDCISKPNCIAIILVDNTVLEQLYYQRQQRQQFHYCKPNAVSSLYAGHYVILWNVIQKGNKISNKWHDSIVVMGNPSRQHSELVDPYILEQAWRAPGTDQDILFLVADDDDHS